MTDDTDKLRRDLQNAESALKALRQGEVDAVIGSDSVILLRLREVEEKLRRSEARYRAVVDSMTELVCRFTPDWRLTFANLAFCRFFGLPLEELIGRKIQPPVLGEEPEKRKRLIFGLCRENPVDGIECRTKVDGETRWIQWTDRLITDAQGLSEYQCVGWDITERKQAEQALERHNRRFKLLSETANSLLAKKNRQEVVNHLCKKVMEHLDCHVFFNYLADEKAGKLTLNAYAGIPDEEARKIAWLDYGEAVCGTVGRDGKRIVARNIQANPDPLTDLVASYGVRAYACHPLISHGKILGTLSFGTRTRGHFTNEDLSLMKTVTDQVAVAMERIGSEEALIESKTHYRELVRGLPVAVYSCDCEGRITMFNEQAASLWMRRPQIGKDQWCGSCKIFRPDGTHLPHEECPMARTLREGRPIKGEEILIERPDGTRAWVLPYSRPSYDYSGRLIGAVNVLVEFTKIKEAQEALRESEQHLRDLIDSMVAMVGVMTPDGTLIEANRTALQVADLQPEDVLKKPFETCYWWAWSPDVQKRLRKAIDRAAAGQGSRYDEIIRVGEGKFMIIDFMLSPMFDVDGRVSYLIPSATDISERKRIEDMLRESEERFRTMADGLPLIVFVTDADGCQQLVNKTYFEFFGVSEEIISSDRWQMLLHPEDASAYVEQFFACLRDRRLFNARVRVKRADGQWRYIESWARPRFSSDGEFIGFVGTGADIHDRIIAEKALKKLNDTLEEQVAERTAVAEDRSLQLQRLAIELSKAEDRERKQIALLLHDDLQQYLAAVRFHLQMLVPKDSGDQNMRERIRPVMQLVDESIKKCRSMSYDLSPPVLHQNGFLSALVWLAEDVEEKHGFKVSLETTTGAEPENEAIASLLFRCVKELLFNAVKHSGADTAVVEVHDEGTWVLLRVKDSGKGFDSAVFAKNKTSVSGFGLFNIQERIKFFGGHFKIESKLGKGCRITLGVPKKGIPKAQKPADLDNEPVPENAKKSDASKESNGYVLGETVKILIADDHAVMRQGLANLLEEEEAFEVIGQVANGNEAVRMASEMSPDIILMDVSMPGMDGIEATTHIVRAHPNIRIIALSMHDDNGTRERMAKAGAAGYIYKASPAEELIRTIRAHACPPRLNF